MKTTAILCAASIAFSVMVRFVPVPFAVVFSAVAVLLLILATLNHCKQ